MSKAPAMPLFVDAYMADTMHLTEAEDGVYMRLLMCMWRMGGKLPNDDTLLARFARITKTQWVRKYRPVLICFFDEKDDVLTQKRLKKELDYVSKNVEKNRANGKRGGRPKSLKNKETDKPNGFENENPNHNPNHNPNESNPSPTHTHVEKSVANATPKKPPEPEIATNPPGTGTGPPETESVGNAEIRPQSGGNRRTRTETGERPGNPVKPPETGLTAKAQAPPKSAENPGKPPVDRSGDDIAQAVAAWNALAAETGLPTVAKLTDKRRGKLKARLQDCGGLDGWTAALEKIRASPGLLGRTGGSWRANFDFVLQESGFIKIMEGNYDGWVETNRRSGESGSVVEAGRRAVETLRNRDPGGIRY